MEPTVTGSREAVRGDSRARAGQAKPIKIGLHLFVRSLAETLGDPFSDGRVDPSPDLDPLIKRVAKDCTVFVSDESGETEFGALDARRFDLHPALLHDTLSKAALLVADTQTITTEAALLGTPAVRSNSFPGEDDMGNFIELEQAGLVHNISEFGAVLEQVELLLSKETVVETWQQRRDNDVSGLVDLTDVLVELAGRVNAIDQVPQVERA